ncbi:MAG: hypothetical protein ACOX7K_08660 [Oscillospiraceae bacterium]|jgi:hypothetical protein
MPYPNCTGAIEECLNCRCTDCRNDRVPSPIRVDDFVKGDNIWERAADHKSARKKQRRHEYYIAHREKNLQYQAQYRRKKKRALLSGN